MRIRIRPSGRRTSPNRRHPNEEPRPPRVPDRPGRRPSAGHPDRDPRARHRSHGRSGRSSTSKFRSRWDRPPRRATGARRRSGRCRLRRLDQRRRREELHRRHGRSWSGRPPPGHERFGRGGRRTVPRRWPHRGGGTPTPRVVRSCRCAASRAEETTPDEGSRTGRPSRPRSRLRLRSPARIRWTSESEP
ncbi:MAG: hypothetical protein CBB77_11005 [Hyphomonas sp. TMED17]|nr:MAG: hypothetical protein CBB77_11005 [Hyphomonas sp. TMED17]